jgi:hypothetical protein
LGRSFASSLSLGAHDDTHLVKMYTLYVLTVASAAQEELLAASVNRLTRLETSDVVQLVVELVAAGDGADELPDVNAESRPDPSDPSVDANVGVDVVDSVVPGVKVSSGALVEMGALVTSGAAVAGVTNGASVAMMSSLLQTVMAFCTSILLFTPLTVQSGSCSPTCSITETHDVAEHGALTKLSPMAYCAQADVVAAQLQML